MRAFIQFRQTDPNSRDWQFEIHLDEQPSWIGDFGNVSSSDHLTYGPGGVTLPPQLYSRFRQAVGYDDFDKREDQGRVEAGLKIIFGDDAEVIEGPFDAELKEDPTYQLNR